MRESSAVVNGTYLCNQRSTSKKSNMNHAKIKIKEADIVKLILSFFNSHSLHVSMRTLEKESGIVNNSYSDDILFLRELILDGDWDEVLLFAQPFEGLKEFHSKQFKYLILKQKFLELLSLKSHIVGTKPSDSIEQVMQTLHQLEENCPSREEFSNLCWLLTVPNLNERNEFREWTLDNSRHKCFSSVLEVIGKVIPVNRKPKRKTNWACKDRLLQLIVKGILYETCIEFCQVQATGIDQQGLNDVSIRTNILQGAVDDYSANLLSWVRSLQKDVFNQPFEHIALEVMLEKLAKYDTNPRHSIDLPRRQKPKSSTHDIRMKSLDNLGNYSKGLAVDLKRTLTSNNAAVLKPNDMFNSKDRQEVAIHELVNNRASSGNLPIAVTNLLSEKEQKPTDYILKTDKLNRVGRIEDKGLHEIKARNYPEHVDKPEASSIEIPLPASPYISNDFYEEKEKQRASVLKKLGEYENRKKLMQQQLTNIDNNSKVKLTGNCQLSSSV